MRHRSLSVLAVLGTLVLMAGPSLASDFVVDQRNDNNGAPPSFQGYTTALTTIGQFFSPTFDTLDHVELYLRASNPGFSSEAHIDIMDAPGGTVLGSSDSQIINDQFVVRHFHFAPIDISAYSSLFLRVVEDFGTLETQVRTSAFLSGGFNVDDYAGGSAYADGNKGGDFWFRTGAAFLPMCGDADGDGIVAGDALRTLREAVGAETICELCTCDVDSSGNIQASDALLVLKEAVGGEVELVCIACE